MKILTIITILFLSISCNNKELKSVKNDDALKDTAKQISENRIVSGIENQEVINEVMSEKDILFNGKLKRYFSVKEFESIFGKTDSIQLMINESPCYAIFENEDGSKDTEDKYFYKEGSRFENTKEKVAVDEFRFTKKNFILFKGKKLNSSTTATELKKLFPNAFKDISQDVQNNGENGFQSVVLREDEDGFSDGHVRMFLKNDKLYSIWWWFPC